MVWSFAPIIFQHIGQDFTRILESVKEEIKFLGTEAGSRSGMKRDVVTIVTERMKCPLL